MIKGLGVQRLVALFFGGMVLFNFPLLALWDRDLTLFGLPLFPAALFIGWGCADCGSGLDRRAHRSLGPD